MARTYRQLNLDQHRTLFRLVEARRPVGEIAARLGRHPSTIYRELGRNRFHDGERDYCGYFPVTAHDLACRRRQRRRKLVAEDALRAHVVARLRRLAEQLNDTPRRCLGYRTPREVFQAHLAAPTGSP